MILVSSPPLDCPCEEIELKFNIQNLGGNGGSFILRLIRSGAVIAEETLATATTEVQSISMRIADRPLTVLSLADDVYEITLIRFYNGVRVYIQDLQLSLLGPLFTPPQQPQYFDVQVPIGLLLPQSILYVITPDFKQVMKKIVSSNSN